MKRKEFEMYLVENVILLAKMTKNKDATQNATQNKKSLQDFSCRLSFNKMGCDWIYLSAVVLVCQTSMPFHFLMNMSVASSKSILLY